MSISTGRHREQLGVFDMFTLGIGPSSSHTVGPMKAGLDFASLLEDQGIRPERIQIRLFGSLAATGIGHGTNRAVLLGLTGQAPETVEVEAIDRIIPEVVSAGELTLKGGATVPFNLSLDLLFEPQVTQEFHVNALQIEAWESEAIPVLSRLYFSTGGGFVMVEDEEGAAPHVLEMGMRTSSTRRPEKPAGATVGVAESEAGASDAARFAEPFALPFTSAEELLARCSDCGGTVAQVVRANEVAKRSADALDEYLDQVIGAMFGCVEQGSDTEGVLPGGLEVPRRASALRVKLQESSADPLVLLDWVTLYALAVNEENAAGHRVVTAPTNGAAGIIPAVLGYFVVSRASARGADFKQLSDSFDLWRLNGLLEAFPELRPLAREFLLAATAVGSIIKVRASIAGAEVGCQGEVGSASAMAAAGLAQALGGSPRQVENAAEIAMEHSLGLTCDPVGGLVQIPCIERNAIGAVKAISAARMALYGDGRHQVSLDVAIETMRQTGADMLDKYKETSIGGLAVNVVEC